MSLSLQGSSARRGGGGVTLIEFLGDMARIAD